VRVSVNEIPFQLVTVLLKALFSFSHLLSMIFHVKLIINAVAFLLLLVGLA
jgi:hypothetical protein